MAEKESETERDTHRKVGAQRVTDAEKARGGQENETHGESTLLESAQMRGIAFL